MIICKPAFHQVLTLLAIAILLALEGCNISKTTSEAPEPKTSTVVTSSTYRPWQKLQLLHTLEAESNLIRSIAISPDSQTVASGSFGGKIKLWNIQSGELLHEINLGTDVRSITFSPDGQTFATAGGNGKVKLWELATGKLVRTLEENELPVDSVDFSPDGQTIARGGWDNNIKLLDIRTGKLLNTL